MTYSTSTVKEIANSIDRANVENMINDDVIEIACK